MLTVALLQLQSSGQDTAANLAKGVAACRQAKTLGADIALFPEMWQIGYQGFLPGGDEAEPNVYCAPDRWLPHECSLPDPYTEARTEWQQLAIGPESDYLLTFCALAHELEMAIAITYLERWDGPPRNTVSLIDRRGKIVLTYAKVHTCAFSPHEEPRTITPGDGFYVAELDTAAGVVNVGAMICYDREFPESARVLMLQGAELILVPNACDLERHRLAQFHIRAAENMVAMAMANYPAPFCNGHSVAYDPIAFDKQGSRDTLVIMAGEQEGIFLAPFDLAALRDYREREAWGNAFRRPNLYSAITDEHVTPPFIRVDKAGKPFR